MLSEAELLPTLAEISVAFAGFASLISVLGGISSREKMAANLWRLRGMLETSVLTLVFSLAPFLPAKFGASTDTSWRMAAAAFSVAILARIAFRIYARNNPSLINPIVAWCIGGLQLLAALLLLSSAVWLPFSMVVGAYHLLLFLVLFVSAYLFVLVAISVLAPTESEPQ